MDAEEAETMKAIEKQNERLAEIRARKRSRIEDNADTVASEEDTGLIARVSSALSRGGK